MEIGTFLPAGTAARLSIGNVIRSRLAIAAVALGLIAVVAAWQWSWLAAIGVAPFLLSVAPCAAMCGLGLCMHRMGGGSCRAANTETPAMRFGPRRIENSTVGQSTTGDMT